MMRYPPGDKRRPLTQTELERIVEEMMMEEAEEITNEMAADSEDGGDTDAEDDLPETHPCNSSKPATLRSETSLESKQSDAEPKPSTNRDSNTETELFEDFDSDDSLRDPDYEPGPRPTRRVLDLNDIEESENSVDESIPDQEETVIQNRNEKKYEWSKTATTPSQFQEAEFVDHVGVNINLNTDSPLSIFLKLLPEKFLVEIVKQTNLYIQQMKRTQSDDVTLEELKAFFGIIIFMGFHRLPSMKLYWSNDENFHVERIARVMPIKRFLFILRYLHLNDNSKILPRDDPGFDKLHKLRPMIETLKTTFFQAYSPCRNISIDESMIGFKGRSTMKQYLPMKPVKRGFKMWACCCAEKGYILNFDLYTGKSDSSGGPLGERVVINLSRPYAKKNYCLFFDNYFSSIPLMDKLQSDNFFACGTIRNTRKQYPSNLSKDKDMAKHGSDYAQTGDIAVVKWKDRGNKSVSVITTMHNPSEIINVLRRDNKGNRLPVTCPVAIAAYNKNMGGVDLFDQYMSFYSIQQKSRRWWLKIFYYLLDACIVNSFIIYNCAINSEKLKGLTHLQFRSKLVNELITNYTSRKRKGYTPVVGRSRKRNCPDGRQMIENSIRLVNVGDHIPEKIKTYRRCAHCSTKQKERRSNMICRMCDVALCKECFSIFHKS